MNHTGVKSSNPTNDKPGYPDSGTQPQQPRGTFTGRVEVDSGGARKLLRVLYGSDGEGYLNAVESLGIGTEESYGPGETQASVDKEDKTPEIPEYLEHAMEHGLRYTQRAKETCVTRESQREFVAQAKDLSAGILDIYSKAKITNPNLEPNMFLLALFDSIRSFVSFVCADDLGVDVPEILRDTILSGKI